MTIRNLATLCAFILATVASITANAQASRTYIDGRSDADGDVPPYSGAVLVGDMLYLAGALGVDEDLQVPDDPAEEARNAMNAIKRNVEAAGMTMDDIVSIRSSALMWATIRRSTMFIELSLRKSTQRVRSSA